MAEEIQEAVQIIRVAYDGIDIAMKIGSGGLSAMQEAVEFLKGMLDYEKSIGKTNMKKLLLKGGDLQVFQFKTADMRKVERLAKKYGLLYSVLPDINKKDGMSEIIFHAEAVPRVNMMIQKLKSGKLGTIDDYLKGGDEKKIDENANFIGASEKGSDLKFSGKVNMTWEEIIEKIYMLATEKKDICVDNVKGVLCVNEHDAERILKQLETIGVLEKEETVGNYRILHDKDTLTKKLRDYQVLADRFKVVSKSKDANLLDVTISKTLILQESETAVKTRIPGTWGDKAKYIWLNKDDIMDIHDGKTMLTFFDGSKEYKIYDVNDRVVETQKGETLYNRHYDKVESEVRKRYEKSKAKVRVVDKTKVSAHTSGRKR